VRIRQVRPEFFSDAVIARLPIASRLTYIGLWLVADDAGWLRWDAPSIGAVLYPFDTPAKRERLLAETFDLLMGAGRLESFACGCVFIPTLSVHQKIGGNKATTIKDAHDKGHLVKAPRPDVRTLVLRRDGYRCRYCGKSSREGAFIVMEHVVNRGPTTLENCVTACSSCNRKKGNRTLEESGLTLLPEPEGDIPDGGGNSRTHPPGSNGSEVSELNGRKRDDEGRADLLAAFAKQGLPVDVA
jgi:hypothetical protein